MPNGPLHDPVELARLAELWMSDVEAALSRNFPREMKILVQTSLAFGFELGGTWTQARLNKEVADSDFRQLRRMFADWIAKIKEQVTQIGN